MTQNSINNSSKTLQVDSVNISTNIISTTTTNSNLNLTPNGTGVVRIKNAYNLPSTSGSANTFFTTDGSGVLSFALSNSFSSLNVQVFTSSGTYTPTAGMSFCEIECIGGGGGGGAKLTTTGQQLAGGSGGLSGSYSSGIFDLSTIGASKTVTVGTGGNGGIGSSDTQPTDGNDSSLGSLITGKGGSAGYNGQNGPRLRVVSPDNAPQIGTGGDINLYNGGSGFCMSVSDESTVKFAKSGFGGAPFYGGGGKARDLLGDNSFSGNNGLGFGAGGSGALGTNNTSAANGGSGASGIVIITEYIY